MFRLRLWRIIAQARGEQMIAQKAEHLRHVGTPARPKVTIRIVNNRHRNGRGGSQFGIRHIRTRKHQQCLAFIQTTPPQLLEAMRKTGLATQQAHNHDLRDRQHLIQEAIHLLRRPQHHQILSPYRTKIRWQLIDHA